MLSCEFSKLHNFSQHHCDIYIYYNLGFRVINITKLCQFKLIRNHHSIGLSTQH